MRLSFPPDGHQRATIEGTDEGYEEYQQYGSGDGVNRFDCRWKEQPGKIFHYSNAGLQIAGAVIEKISGKSFEELFAERIAVPLGMKNTDFGKKNVAMPAGGARSTTEDYLTFLTMILNKGSFGGKQILTGQSVNEMQINRIGSDVKVEYSPAEAKGLGYGYGEWVDMSEDGKPSSWATSPGLVWKFPMD